MESEANDTSSNIEKTSWRLVCKEMAMLKTRRWYK